MTTSILNALTVDVEDYFQVQAFAETIARTTWADWPRRVEANTELLLGLFAEKSVRATFFTLGWVAERHPALIRRIVAGGHELASHGYGHERVDALTEMAFRADIVRAKGVLEDAGGVAVAGYRAPTFSVGPRTPWAFATLAEAGYRYSSSVYPVRHDLYGLPGAPRFPYRHDGCGLLELPMTTLRLGGRNLPLAGGGWFRLVPYRLFRAALRHRLAAECRPAVFYLHPWEIDPGQPRVPGAGRRARLRHYTGLAGMAEKLRKLLGDFAWDRMDHVFAAALAPSLPAAATTSA
jgi:polysaccharide deacetylase family protein (PEP-CTERM system associated)